MSAREASLSLPWLDRRGEFSMLKAVVFAGILLPGLWLILRAISGNLGPRAMIEINHQAGLWTVRFLLLTLAVTPLRFIWRWPELVFLRRMLGVSVFAYAAIHLVAYTGDLVWDVPKVVSEIFARPYLTIGFAAFIMLIPLAATSTNGMMRRMGGLQWRALHKLIYPIAALASVHFFLQSKLGVTEPIVIAALAIWLGAWRVLAARIGEQRAGSFAVTIALAALIVVATAFGEALYYYLKIGVPFSRILPTNFAWKSGIRPAWIVLGIALVVIAVAYGRSVLDARKPRGRRAQAGVAAKPSSSPAQRQGKAA
ncbi:sulfoxide reductase heme-binding subunit YedZ [Mesorhizobium sp. BR1-1-16]|uniref:sulfite oxidase heme-binding subunit YedZ n=1 Tax=Mesorhizobium sp. BR1-1-16 TaxID=2876653 RepID=UPI001CCAD55A|nr:protein-methionine-sulfoxide reductase heme-binding subunit MsrQ [Mesorhizobium sp. BR1-1-16]MBZ9935799.1 sulfoxide reductase heme-binding subunit YedZ [Mesorhizobium sp. BR1-1-16]